MAKTFDCVAWQDREALRIHTETRGLTRDQELAYWARHSHHASPPKSSKADTPSMAREAKGPYGRGG